MGVLALLLMTFAISAYITRKEAERRLARQRAKEVDTDQFVMAEVPFAPGAPTTWDEYKGQERVKRLAQLIVDTCHETPHPKLMMVGSKGLGKTALARIFAKQYIEDHFANLPRELRDSEAFKRGCRYIEVTPSMFETKQDLDALMNSIELFDVLFIDEVHMFDRRLADTLLPALAENYYPFDGGMRALPPAFAWVAATTDIGKLPEAFVDRWQVVQLEPLDVEQLTEIVKMQPWPITDEAALEIATRSAGWPREVKRVYARAKDVSVQKGTRLITPAEAREAFDLLDLDANGLYTHDRAVLRALHENPKFYARGGIRYAQSARAIQALTGLDEEYYLTQVEPKLLRLGYITIGTGGRELTPKAKETYFGTGS